MSTRPRGADGAAEEPAERKKRFPGAGCDIAAAGKAPWGAVTVHFEHQLGQRRIAGMSQRTVNMVGRGVAQRPGGSMGEATAEGFRRE